jgi:hypothetical protein
VDVDEEPCIQFDEENGILFQHGGNYQLVGGLEVELKSEGFQTVKLSNSLKLRRGYMLAYRHDTQDKLAAIVKFSNDDDSYRLNLDVLR